MQLTDTQDNSYLHYPSDLPIVEKRETIIEAVRENQVLVITGETGSGKSTQIPKMCLEAGLGRRKWIGCTQPRRIAAITLANRVAEEMAPKSHWVGHKIRFQDRTTRSTRIKFMTDGVLLAEAQSDRLFRGYDAVIVDEAHERTLNIDFLLGLIKKTLPRRKDLKVIITSATIDPEKFSHAFGHAPIIEVSGRTYPVDVRYRPPELSEDGDDDATYIDNAIAAVDSLKRTGGPRGDILVFMPTESDIRETVQRLDEKRYWNTLVLPLFGRMAASDQQRIFQPSTQDKVIVATNVAETSVTIPRIKYVVDTGLARISQYNARSRTQGLPVVPVSQSAADQRKGRCGRVEAGICVRLYSEEDYLARPLYTPPEMQRANLAEVILRMLFLRFGSVQDFPFIDPPSPAAIKDGYAVLKELNAIDSSNHLTPHGRMMAKLPLDPRLARILIEARNEGALREVMILAAALSIQDPRERPLEQEAQADQAHAKFRDPRSDFVTLLKIWEAYEHRWESVKSQAQMRKFCRENFLSYRRMREWRDVHEEIGDILSDLGELKPNTDPASFDAIHRAIVSGYLSNIAMRKDKNIYLGARGRQLMVFPGSGLFNKAGAWIVASEVVQTSRLFARTVAEIQPEWIEELGNHLCRRSYFEPHWEKKRGQVVAYERVTLYGLIVVDRRKVNYSRIEPEKAREIFIQSALVEGELPETYGFMEHNRELIRQIEELESKTRRRNLLVDDFTLYRFYDERLPLVSDVRAFNRLIKDRENDHWLRMTEADLLRDEPDFQALDRFPDSIELGDLHLPLRYVFQPGASDDGVTVTAPVRVLQGLPSDPFEWLVPGMLTEKVTFLLKALPKSIRKRLVPVGDTAQELVGRLPFREGNLYAQLSRCLQELKGVQAPIGEWDPQAVPDYLRMRFEVVNPEGEKLGEGRNLNDLKSITVERHEDHIWNEARKAWEREGAVAWEFGDLPQKIELGEDAFGVKRFAYPGIVSEGATVSLRLFADPAEAMEATRDGFMLLYQLTLASELKKLKKDWVFPESMTSVTFFMGSRREADRRLQDYVLRELFELNDPVPPERARFERVVQKLRGRIAGLGQDRVNEVLQVIGERERTRACLKRFQHMATRNPAVLQRLDDLSKELEALVPSDFLDQLRPCRMEQLPRYLKALQVRAERVYIAPEKDYAKAEQIIRHAERYEEMKREVLSEPTPLRLELLDAFRWGLEDLKISIFAPEIRTRQKISGKRLEEKWQEWLSTKGKLKE
jgi:ATP-dependent helicase HrpA